MGTALKTILGLNFPLTAKALITIILATTLAPSAYAQTTTNWPTHSLTMIVPGAAGGTTDIPTRLVAQKLSARLGQSIVVENKPGTGGILGVQALLKNPADGYTLLVGNTGSNAVNYRAYKNNNYKPSDFIAISDLISFANVLVVNADSPVKNVADLVARLKKEPGKLTYPSAGIGQLTHLMPEMFKVQTKTDALHIPYKGSVPATMSVLSGETAFMFDNLTQALPQIQAGKLRVLAVTSAERVSSLPNVPTMKESGYPDFVVTGWLGFFVRSQTPPDIVKKLQENLIAVLNDPEIKNKFIEMGGMPGGSPQPVFSNFVSAEVQRWSDLIERAKLSLD